MEGENFRADILCKIFLSSMYITISNTKSVNTKYHFTTPSHLLSPPPAPPNALSYLMGIRWESERIRIGTLRIPGILLINTQEPQKWELHDQEDTIIIIHLQESGFNLPAVLIGG